MSEEKPEITNFLSKNQIGVLATVDDTGQPHAATIYFAIDPDLTLYFMTKEDTTKCRNIQKNPLVSVAIYEPSTQTTAQIMGTATKVDQEARAMEVFRRVLNITAATSESHIPPVSKLTSGGYICFSIKPKSIRLAEYTKPEHNNFGNIFDTVAMPDSELK